MLKKKYVFVSMAVVFFAVLLGQRQVFAMHIMEGFLPPTWAILWFVASAPFFLKGIKNMNKLTKDHVNIKMLLGLCGAFAFVLSSLKLPSVTGSSSHATGVGLGAILFGPTISSVLALIVLLFQAILLAHGGLTTLGANVFSMGIVGPFTSFVIFKGLDKLGMSKGVRVFLAAALGNMATYIVTSIQLGLAFPTEVGLLGAIGKFMGIFAVTQIPLAIIEGLITVVVYNLLTAHNQEELKELKEAWEGK